MDFSFFTTDNKSGYKTKFSNRLDRGYNEFCSLPCFNNNKSEMVKRIKDTNQKKSVGWGRF